MLENLGSRVCELVEEGVGPGDITILSSYADIVTELVLSGILSKRGIGLVNISGTERASDSRLCRALLSFAALCHPGYGIYPSRDDYRLLCEMLFGLDPVRACTLAAKIGNTLPHASLPGPEWPGLQGLFGQARQETYLTIRGWVQEYMKFPDADPGVFLQRALLELFLKIGPDRAELEKAKQLVGDAADFYKIVSRFGRNAGRDFTGNAGKKVRVGMDSRHTGRLHSKQDVVFTTPSAYLKSGIESRITIISGLSSDNWSPARVRELVNPNVLSGAWKAERVYTSADEEADRLLYLADTFRAVVQSCGERLITFESLLNANGYENNGILPEVFEIIL
jgi:hypothetical protein